MGELQLVVFSLNNEIYGADTSQVRQILRYQEVTKVPGMPEFMEGVINMRGKVVPVINLNSRFSLGDTNLTKKTKIIVTSANDKDIGYVVNDVLEIIKLPEDDIEVMPELLKKAGSAYLKGVGKKGEKLISIIDLENILNEAETERLCEK